MPLASPFYCLSYSPHNLHPVVNHLYPQDPVLLSRQWSGGPHGGGDGLHSRPAPRGAERWAWWRCVHTPEYVVKVGSNSIFDLPTSPNTSHRNNLSAPRRGHLGTTAAAPQPATPCSFNPGHGASVGMPAGGPVASPIRQATWTNGIESACVCLHGKCSKVWEKLSMWSAPRMIDR